MVCDSASPLVYSPSSSAYSTPSFPVPYSYSVPEPLAQLDVGYATNQPAYPTFTKPSSSNRPVNRRPEMEFIQVGNRNLGATGESSYKAGGQLQPGSAGKQGSMPFLST